MRVDVFVSLLTGSLVVVACGELAPPVDELRISCGANGECPSDFYCGEGGTCQPDDEGSPPKLRFDGIRIEGNRGDYAEALTVPRSERTEIEYKVTNIGGASARRVKVRLVTDACPAFEFSNQLLVARSLGPDDSVEESEVVAPSDDCDAPTDVAVQMETATQRSSSSFELRLE